ncbi:MAG: hypothetical protein J6Y31_00365 [Bacteroidales bacterium]|nr:hypothetical protein [Bacteroidales bacterium]
MKKIFSFSLMLAAAVCMIACEGKKTEPTPGGNGGGGGGSTSVTATITADAAFVDGSAAVNAALSVAATATTTLSVTVADNSELPADNVEVSDILIAKNQKNGSTIISATPDGLEAAGDYNVVLNITGPEGVTVSGSPVTIKYTVTPDQIKPARKGKALKITPDLSKNFLFSGSTYNFLTSGGTFQVKFKANAWKNNAQDRLCCFETQDENPAFLIRFSGDDAEDGQLQLNANNFRIGTYSKKDGQNYIFKTNEWHVVTIVMQPMTNYRVTISLYDNEVKLDDMASTANMTTSARSDNFYLQRFELGMSWDDGSGYPELQLLDGVVDYIRVWTKQLSASEIASTLCDVPGDTEGLLVYNIFGEIDADGKVANKATAGGTTFDLNFADMKDMDGNTIKGSVDNKEKAIAALDADATNLCKFPEPEPAE